MAIGINNFIMYLNNGNYENDFKMFLNYLADNKNNTTIIRDRDKIIVNEEIFIIFNESLKNKHFNFSDIVFNKTVTFQTNRENGLEFNFENTYFEKLNILNCDVDNIIFSGEINYIKESNISECKIKGVTINSNIEGDVKFQKCIFEDFNKYNSGKNIKFGANFVFDFCETEDITNLMNFDFENRVSFKMSKFKNNIYFNNSYFKDYVDFHECEFEKTACFYGVTFDKTPNFSQTIFKGNLNIVNANLNFDFKSLENKIEEEYKAYNHIKHNDNLCYIKRFFKYLLSLFNKTFEDAEKYQKPLPHFANDFRDSFRIFKNTLIKDNNLLDASKFHRCELYCKELELDSKKTKTLKDKVEKWQLWFYRKLCDHHTDILQSFHSLMLVIGLFGLMGFGVITGFNYYYLGYKPIFSHLYVAKEIYDAHIQTFIKTHTLYTFAFNFFILAFYLGILVYLISAKCLRRLFIGISYVVVICILLVSPKILIPAMGIFTDKRALLDPLSTLGGIYTICFGFVLFSFIKTIRKNSIVPN